MKSGIKIIFLTTASVIILAACNKTLLDKTAQDKYTETQVWTDISLADRYLLDNYNNSLTGGFGYLSFASITDESHDTHAFGTENYLQGNINSSNTSPFGIWAFNYTTWDAMYNNIQKLNIFLANIDNVPAAYPPAEQPAIVAQASRMRGEALFLRAFCYSQLARNYGGVILATTPFAIGDDYLSQTRAGFRETIDFISQQCDEAAALLEDKDGMEMGRATKGAALALKSRILLFAASDLTASGTAENEYVGYTAPDRAALWTAAKNAAKAVMDLGAYQLADFGAPNAASVAENFYNFFKAKDLSSPEVIWGKLFLKNVGARNQMNLINGSNGFVMYGCNAPTANLVDAFEMADGSKFSSHYSIDGNGYYRNTSTKYTSANIYYNREPRFYATILYDSAIWMKRYADLAPRDPLGIYDRRTRITVQNGQETSRIYGIDTRQGPVDGDDGTYTGYTFKKYQDNEVYGTETNNNENVWIEFRYAEVLMNYAEACLGLGQQAEAATYINMIRNRAGLPDYSGDAKTALQHERQVEFVHEDIRWYDMRRWKILDQTMVDAKGVDIIETNNRDNNTVTTTWRQIFVQQRGPVQNKMYWVPIPIDEMNRAPQLVQNPGY
ncbi:RagB/SusD family nutrient uptake outer membrane protein [Foetidibacter luteolus]|uniref:RagB/SusD family nutrient uptake outer membrane protein n=1 Tax=Foetidibacter luteolus TaxID=2608880 RepID=UPI00129B74A8|nr:RagB/SusD family nutrient uptake outer membrane protein [Foetidibacter luteolus]